MTSGSRIPPPWVFCLYIRSGVLAAIAQPCGKFEWVSGPPMSSMRASLSSRDSGTMLNGAIALTKPSGPPSWLAPLSDSTITIVSSSWPVCSSVAITPAEVLIEVVEHRGVRPGESAEQALLVRGMFVPGEHTEVAGRQLGACRDDAELDLCARGAGRARRPNRGRTTRRSGRSARAVPGAGRDMRRATTAGTTGRPASPHGGR